MKKILVDLVKLKHLYTGLGQVSWNFGKNLANFAFGEFDLTYLLPPEYKNFAGDQVKYHTPDFFMRYFKAKSQICDIWHSIHQDSPYMPGTQSRYLLTIHDLNFLRDKSEAKIASRLKKLQKKVNRADMVTFISEFTGNEARRYLEMKKPSRVIYNGVDTPKNPLRPEFMDRIHQPFYFTIGVVLPKKNFHVLVDLMSKDSGRTLVIAGDKNSSYASKIESMIRERGLENRIFLPGIVKDEEKAWLYQNMEAFFFPSINEGFGLPVVEALYFGKPVFLSTSTSLPEIGSDCACYWESFDPDYMFAKVKEYMEKNNGENQAGRRKKRAEEFTWKKNVNSYLEIYRMLSCI